MSNRNSEMRDPIVAVCGTSQASPAEYAMAEEAGRSLAAAGYTVVCGGLGGVMEAVASGAREVGGTCIGFLPGDNSADGNAHLAYAIPTGMGEMRNGLLARMSVAMLAIGGGWGTLSEIGFMRRLGKPVACVSSWYVRQPGEVERDLSIYWSESVADAVEWIRAGIEKQV